MWGVLISCVSAVVCMTIAPYQVVITPSHPHNAGMKHVGFSPTKQMPRAPSAKRRETPGESHDSNPFQSVAGRQEAGRGSGGGGGILGCRRGGDAYPPVSGLAMEPGCGLGGKYKH